jgi:hypothetical protein
MSEQIPLSQIDSDFYERVSYNQDALNELAANLKAVGYNIDPIILRPLKDKLQVVKVHGSLEQPRSLNSQN